jgi:hypothetical protein
MALGIDIPSVPLGLGRAGSVLANLVLPNIFFSNCGNTFGLSLRHALMANFVYALPSIPKPACS